MGVHGVVTGGQTMNPSSRATSFARPTQDVICRGITGMKGKTYVGGHVFEIRNLLSHELNGCAQTEAFGGVSISAATVFAPVDADDFVRNILLEQK